MSDLQLVTLTGSDLGKVQMLCAHSPTYRRGYDAKLEWLRYTLVQVRGHNAGMIEYIPGEYAWRAVEAKGTNGGRQGWVPVAHVEPYRRGQGSDAK